MAVFVLRIIKTIWVLFAARCFRHVDATEVERGVARSVPFIDTAISGPAFHQFAEHSRVRCLSECSRLNCSSFNFGNGECHLHNTYICEGFETLVAMAGFKYYDVERDDMIPVSYFVCD